MYKSGYSVLLLTIIISTVGVTLAINALSNSTQIAKTNINITDAVLDQSKASSCVEKVFAKLRSYKFYGGDETFEDGCRVYTISGMGNSERIIHTKVDFTILETKIIQIQPTVVIDYQKQISNEELTQNQVNNPYLIDPLALRLWLKADRAEVNNGQSVLSVKNATNDLINFAQVTTAPNLAPKLITNAINNRPALRFDGVDDFLTSTTTSIHTNNGLSIIVVGKANSTGNNQTNIGKFDATNNEREWRLQNDDFIATDLATAETANETVSFANNTNVRIISATWAPNQLASVNLNSDNAINATSPVVADISNTTEPIIVGANAQGGAGFLNGNIAEILVYNKKLSTEELNKIKTYLNTKYIPTKDGSSATKAATSAASLVAQGITTDGVYWIDLPTVGPTQVYCILNPAYDGGGWMMAMKATAGNTFNYNANYWTTANTLNPTDTTTNNADAKFNTMNNFEAKDIMAIWPDISPNGTESGSIDNMSTWTWLENNFYGGNRVVPITFWNAVDRYFIRDAKAFNGWASGRFSSQVDVRFYGFNYRNNNGSARVRWGFGWNENGGGLYPNGDMNSDDVSGGIGMSYGVNYSAGDRINCCSDTTGINRSARVEVYIR